MEQSCNKNSTQYLWPPEKRQKQGLYFTERHPDPQTIATPEFANADETKQGPCYVLPAAGFPSSSISISMVKRENCLSDFLNNSIKQYCIGTITIITCAPEWNRRQSLWPRWNYYYQLMAPVCLQCMGPALPERKSRSRKQTTKNGSLYHGKLRLNSERDGDAARFKVGHT